jgi:hypothetical protein
MNTSTETNPQHRNPYEYAPMPELPEPAGVCAALLKHPGQLIYEIIEGRAGIASKSLLMVALLGLAIFGIVVGSFCGGSQYWIAPAKILFGSMATACLCLPSLYVFLCLNGANARLPHVAALLLTGVALMAVLLVSLAPIAWIFSQSTDSVVFIACLHLILWSVAVAFGLRLLLVGASLVWGDACRRLGVWITMYLLVCLQMMTTLRPLIGSSSNFLPAEKMFFLAHWMKVIGGH